jgi:hypothetical protein
VVSHSHFYRSVGKMNDIVAFVVGIEKYDQPSWDVPGPCRNALEIAKYLIGIGAKPANIFLFANEKTGAESPTACEQEIAELKTRGVKYELPTRENIDNYFNRLMQNRDANSRLFFYWSGHGFTDKEDNYIFICADYSSRVFKGKVFDATHRLLRLRSVQFKSFSQQIFLADVCAKEAEVEFGMDRDVLDGPNRRARQLAFFATRHGDYSRGAFSAVALKLLKSMPQWPELNQLSDSLWQALKSDAHLEPLMVSSFSQEKKILNESVGQPRGDGIAEKVYGLLSGVALRREYRDYYAATMSDLGMREASGKPDLWRMIHDLSDLQYGSAHHLPYGLVQFLVRVSRDPDAGPAIDLWIKQNAALIHKHYLTSIEETLATEQAEKILVFEVENDLSEPTKLSWFVCSRDNSTLSAAEPEQDVKDWTDLGEKVMTVVDRLENQGTTIAEIHFAVESTLFDRDFHRISRPNAACLGEQYIVVLRHLSRVYKSKASPVRKTWEGWATALRGVQPAEVKRIRIPPDRNNLSRLFEDGKGLCYAGFIFACPTDALPTERDVMKRLVELMGVPYLFWLQRAPKEEWASDLDCQLERWLAEGNGLGQFPSTLREKRAGAEEFASYGALLWDDPNFLPFTQNISPG